ncbi:MAG: beta propeller repeat protein [Candidatus Dormibacteria bacterium]
MTSPTVAWMALARGTLMVTRDGGRTWEAAIPSALLAGSSGAAAVAFAGPTSGWALAGVVGEPGGSSATDVVFRTVDGGRRWAPVG